MLSALLMHRRVAAAFIGIGILVEIVRRLGMAFVEIRKQER
jgi:hypothetical protein